MANWRYTTIQHPARMALGLTVVEYCVLDIIYQSQTHPSYTKNGWSDAGCHTIGRFLGLSSGTVKGIFDRLEKFGFLEKGVGALKRTTSDFHDVAYIQNEEEISSVQKLNVQKLNTKRSKAEQASVRMLNGKRSKAEHISKLNESVSNSKESIVELHSTVTLIDEVDETSVEIHHVPEYFADEQINPTPQVAPPPPRPKAKRAKTDDPTPIRAMFELYADKYAELNNGVKPEFMVKYTSAMKNLYGILRARSITSGFVPLDNLEPWRDFLTAWTDYLAKNEKEKWHRDNFNPLTFFSQFNSIIAKLNNRPKTDAEKWMDFARRNGVL